MNFCLIMGLGVWLKMIYFIELEMIIGEVKSGYK